MSKANRRRQRPGTQPSSTRPTGSPRPSRPASRARPARPARAPARHGPAATPGTAGSAGPRRRHAAHGAATASAAAPPPQPGVQPRPRRAGHASGTSAAPPPPSRPRARPAPEPAAASASGRPSSRASSSATGRRSSRSRAIAVIALVSAFVFLSASQPAYACSTIWTPAPTASPTAGATPNLGYAQPDQGASTSAAGAKVTYTYCAPASGNHFNVPGVSRPDPRSRLRPERHASARRAGSTTSSMAGW